MVGKRKLETNVANSAKRERSGRSDPFRESGFLGLQRERETQRFITADQAKADSFGRITTEEVTDETKQTFFSANNPDSVHERQFSPEDFNWAGNLAPICDHILLKNCSWPAVEDLIYCGRSTCWQDQSPSGTELVTEDWYD